MNSYHNTNRLRGRPLSRAMAKAKSQEEIILLFFKAYPQKSYAPHEILKLLDVELYNPPLTSVRRAMSNLAREGHLVKTKNMIDGPFGMKVHQWKLKSFKKPTQPDLFQ